MDWENKVVWSEGLFLQQHHFQQQDRYLDFQVRSNIRAIRSFAWGLDRLEINDQSLDAGMFSVSHGRGIFPDGTYFDIPGNCEPPAALKLGDSVKNSVVFLRISAQRLGGSEFGVAEKSDSVTRYFGKEIEVMDSLEDSSEAATMEVAKLRLHYAIEGDDEAGYVSLPLARVLEVRADNQIVMDREFIPPVLSIDVSETLKNYVGEIYGLLNFRGETLAKTASGAATGSVNEVQAFLLLQAVNRYEPLMTHLSEYADIHPLDFFRKLLELLGEFSTFGRVSKRPIQCPTYDHSDLQTTFAPIMEELRRILRIDIDVPALQIPLQIHESGFRTGVVSDIHLFDTARFVLVTSGEHSVEAMRQHFPNQIKVGPIESIRDIVSAAIPGIPIKPLPAAPRQIPDNPSAMYFELDKANRYWAELPQSRAMALHLSERFLELDLQLWAIKGG